VLELELNLATSGSSSSDGDGNGKPGTIIGVVVAAVLLVGAAVVISVRRSGTETLTFDEQDESVAAWGGDSADGVPPSPKWQPEGSTESPPQSIKPVGVPDSGVVVARSLAFPDDSDEPGDAYLPRTLTEC